MYIVSFSSHVAKNICIYFIKKFVCVITLQCLKKDNGKHIRIRKLASTWRFYWYTYLLNFLFFFQTDPRKIEDYRQVQAYVKWVGVFISKALWKIIVGWLVKQLTYSVEVEQPWTAQSLNNALHSVFSSTAKGLYVALTAASPWWLGGDQLTGTQYFHWSKVGTSQRWCCRRKVFGLSFNTYG